MTQIDMQAFIRRYFDTWKSADRDAFELMITSDFTFTSPQDDHIDRSAFFERCWPLAGTQDHAIELIAVDGEDAVVHYNGESASGDAFRNIERFSFDGDRIRAVEVFFGLPMGSSAGQPAEQEIRTLLDQRQEALQLKDARLVAAKHANVSETFGLAPPLKFDIAGTATLNEWFGTWKGMIEWETRDPKITVSGNVAFVSALEHMNGVKTDGEDVDLWFRLTLGLRRIDGEWKIVHEHQSVPFYMDGSFEAAVDLKPGDSPRQRVGTADKRHILHSGREL